MSSFVHGVRNAFRNWIRTFSVTIILAISVGLALVMLLCYRTVQAKLENVKSSIGNTITVTPAGAFGFEGGGEPLTSEQLSDLKSVAHVTSIEETLLDRLTQDTNTSLASSIDAGTLGDRQNRFNQGRFETPTNRNNRSSGEVRVFAPPIVATGISDTAALQTNGTSLSSGELFDPSKDDTVAAVGKDLATKNNLSVGSTFTLYNTNITVKAIFDTANNRFANNGIFLPIKTLQQLSGQTDQVSSAVITVDSIANMSEATANVKSKLGDKADVSSTEETAKQALTPLENIKSITLSSLIGALVAGAVITLLTMIMIVRERRREIGVLKAIGASNLYVVTQFISEALILTFMGSLLGVLLGIFYSNPILKALVASNVSTGGGGPMVMRQMGGGFRAFGQAVSFGGAQNLQNSIRDIHAVVSYDILLYGLLTAILIAVVGSAIPAWLIAKVRPSEVMRGE